MDKISKRQFKFLENTINSLYEVEDFLNKYNTFSDMFKIIKIIKKH